MDSLWPWSLSDTLTPKLVTLRHLIIDWVEPSSIKDSVSFLMAVGICWFISSLVLAMFSAAALLYLNLDSLELWPTESLSTLTCKVWREFCLILGRFKVYSDLVGLACKRFLEEKAFGRGNCIWCWLATFHFWAPAFPTTLGSGFFESECSESWYETVNILGVIF